MILTRVNCRLHFEIFALDARMFERLHEPQQFESHRTDCLGIHVRVYWQAAGQHHRISASTRIDLHTAVHVHVFYNLNYSNDLR